MGKEKYFVSTVFWSKKASLTNFFSCVDSLFCNLKILFDQLTFQEAKTGEFICFFWLFQPHFFVLQSGKK